MAGKSNAVGDKVVRGAEFCGRATQQRQFILEVIEQADRHLDAEEIYQCARHRSPRISISTVYRNLRFLKQQGLVEEHQLHGLRRCYERIPEDGHHHMVCMGCGRVFEFKCPLTERLRSRISQDQGFMVTEVEVRLNGYCLECQEQLSIRKKINKKDYQERG